MSYHNFSASKLMYDYEADGVWIYDIDDDPLVFLGRNTIIKALGLLPSNPPDSESWTASTRVEE